MTARLILASGSPRRSYLLADAGLRFEVLRPTVAESASRALTVCELTAGNAARKAREIARVHPDAVVVGADTLVSVDQEIIGKPADLCAAFETLRRLSGREHQVCTGVFICSIALRRQISFCAVSDVRFKKLTDDEIRAHMTRINPLDKAGGYAAQEHGSEIIERIRGSFTNVVGLPMSETLAALCEFGVGD
ncbi:MAG: Maf family protein [Verrucomicrobiota bacterium]|nr:Maf family protein [Verrucomicrobiota bacterium]